MKALFRAGLSLALAVGGCSNDPPAAHSSNHTQALSASEREPRDHEGVDWGQWGGNPQHDGAVRARGQPMRHLLTTLTTDQFVPAEAAERFGDLTVHYQSPLIDGDDVFMLAKTGSFVSCDPVGSGNPFPCGAEAWNTQIWNEKRLHWEHGALVEKWSFESDWKPPRNSNRPVNRRSGLVGWEPVFHPALTEDFLFVPGAHGSVYRVDRRRGTALAHLTPFGDDPNVYVSGPVVADAEGAIYYNAIRFDGLRPWSVDVVDSFVVKVSEHDRVSLVTYASLTADVAPAATDGCINYFIEFGDELPFPPSPTATPASFPCGSQRPGVNLAPALAPDGTVYLVSRAHFDEKTTFLIALDRHLRRKWARPMKGLIVGGCGTPELPPNGAPGGCRVGSKYGVDPLTNEPPAVQVNDIGSSTPVVAPDGSVLFGGLEFYSGRGHLVKFSPAGEYQGAYDFGWDSTPAISRHDGTYSIVIKDNHYGAAYCFSDPDLCPFPLGEVRYEITQLDKNLNVEWHFRSTNTQSCSRAPDGTVTCVDDHPEGFEWCINAPAVDRDGVVYGNSEDGNVYAIGPGGVERERFFTRLAIGAAYTPLAIGRDGKIYAQNDGALFVLGR